MSTTVKIGPVGPCDQCGKPSPLPALDAMGVATFPPDWCVIVVRVPTEPGVRVMTMCDNCSPYRMRAAAPD